MRALLAIAALALSEGCTTIPYVRGPGVPRGTAIVRVEVETLEVRGGPRVIEEEQSLRRAVRLFSEQGWQPNDDNPLKAHHRVTLIAKDGRRFRYCVGAFSDPPRPPCFSLCSGFWVAAATSDGRPRKDLYLSRATSSDLFDLMDLLEKK